jgi:ribosome biogenesis GTPase
MAAEVTGRFRHIALDHAAFPAVGDWVAARLEPSAGKALIHEVLPRRHQTFPGKRQANAPRWSRSW